MFPLSCSFFFYYIEMFVNFQKRLSFLKIAFSFTELFVVFQFPVYSFLFFVISFSLPTLHLMCYSYRIHQDVSEIFLLQCRYYCNLLSQNYFCCVSYMLFWTIKAMFLKKYNFCCYSLIHWLFGSLLFNLYIFVNFPVFSIDLYFITLCL